MSIVEIKPNDAIKAAHRKDKGYFYSCTGLVLNDSEVSSKNMCRSIVDIRLYKTGNTVYSCVWINDRKSKIYATGSGRASGTGYNKKNSATFEAISNAGVIFLLDNENELYGIVEDILKYLGYDKYYIHESHA